MKKYYSLALLLLPALAAPAQLKKTVSKELAGKIKADPYFPFVKSQGL